MKLFSWGPGSLMQFLLRTWSLWNVAPTWQRVLTSYIGVSPLTSGAMTLLMWLCGKIHFFCPIFRICKNIYLFIILSWFMCNLLPGTNYNIMTDIDISIASLGMQISCRVSLSRQVWRFLLPWGLTIPVSMGIDDPCYHGDDDPCYHGDWRSLFLITRWIKLYQLHSFIFSSKLFLRLSLKTSYYR
jgi:hypothetical protein